MRALFWSLVALPERWRVRRELAGRTLTVPGDGVAVNYGGALAGGGLVAGGKVKLLHLRERWAERDDFNVLYLVSSAAPRHAAELVRWARARGARLVWNQNGVGFPAWAGKGTASTNAPMAELLGMADHVVYQSAFCRESADRWLGPARAPASVLFNPVDLDFFSPAAVAPDAGEDWHLLAAGTHYQPFRVLGALETLRALLDAGHRARLTVAGELRWPGAAEQVAATRARLGLEDAVTLRAAFSQAEAVALYRSAHVLLHLKYHDPCPTVVIEALACGVPVIGSRTGGLTELVGEDGGALLPVETSWEAAAYPSPGALAAECARIFSNWPAHSAAARGRAARLFSHTAWVEAHAGIFSEVIKR